MYKGTSARVGIRLIQVIFNGVAAGDVGWVSTVTDMSRAITLASATDQLQSAKTGGGVSATRQTAVARLQAKVRRIIASPSCLLRSLSPEQRDYPVVRFCATTTDT